MKIEKEELDKLLSTLAEDPLLVCEKCSALREALISGEQIVTTINGKPHSIMTLKGDVYVETII